MSLKLNVLENMWYTTVHILIQDTDSAATPVIICLIRDYDKAV